MSYLWDTNVAIYFLNDQFSASAAKYVDDTVKTESPSISVISELELLSWSPKVEIDIITIHRFVGDCQVMELDDLTKINTIEIRRRYKLKLPDAIIAATAISKNYTLISRNSKDFRKIENLKFVNPFDFKN
jgi:predicted nucleic acid-binding protein